MSVQANQASRLFDRDDAAVIHSAFSQARAFVSADLVLQDLDPEDVEFALAGVIRMLVKGGGKNVTELASGAVSRLREREQIKRSLAHLYAKHHKVMDAPGLS